MRALAPERSRSSGTFEFATPSVSTRPAKVTVTSVSGGPTERRAYATEPVFALTDQRAADVPLATSAPCSANVPSPPVVTTQPPRPDSNPSETTCAARAEAAWLASASAAPMTAARRRITRILPLNLPQNTPTPSRYASSRLPVTR
jgi:hypothetical protein